VTLSKLSLRNAKRQTGDYLIYFVTIIMAAALLYAFNGLVCSDEIMELSTRLSNLPIAITLSSVVGVCIFGWLVSYATNFMLTRRSRELGTYILIGLENKQVARLFFLENLAVGAVAFLLGLLLGGLIYQILRALILSLFEQVYRFSLTFSLRAAGLTLLYFSLIYLLALRKSQKRIRKMKIYDLIYFERQNEGKVIKSGRGRRRLSIVSIVLGIVGTLLLMLGNMLFGIVGAGCIIVFLYGFFISFASSVPAFFDKHPVKKYNGQTLLVFRSLTAKLATMGALMGTIALLFTATLITEGSGLMFHGLFEGRAADNACFDLYIGMEGAERDPAPYLDYITAHIPVEQSVLYKIYEGETSHIGTLLDSEYYYFGGYYADPILRYSDYAALRSIAGYDSVELESGQYLIHCRPNVASALKGYSQSINIGGKTMIPGAIYTEHLLQGYSVSNGRGFILVVPDETTENLRAHHLAYAAKTIEPVSQTDIDALYDIGYQIYKITSHDDYVTTRVSEINEMAWSTAILVFPLYFLALALSMTAATILTIQQLSESNRYRRQFELLRKLGMERQDMIKALRTQSTIYYAMPAAPPVLIGIPFLLYLANQPEPDVMVGLSSPAAIVIISLSLFFLIYAVYIFLAYTSLKRNVLPDV